MNTILSDAPSVAEIPKTYLDYVLDYFLVLTAICSVFVSCLCVLYSIHLGGMKHVFRFVSLNLVFCIAVTNTCAMPRMLATNEVLKCEISAIVDHYFWIAQNCWICSLAFESFKNMPVLNPCVDFRRRAILHAVLCYVLPTVLLSVTAIAHYSQAHWLGFLYGGRFCSLANVALFIFSSILPTSLVIILSVVFLLIAIYRFQPAKHADAQIRNITYSYEIERTRKWLITSLMFIFVAGICWCIHLFYNVLQVTISFYFSLFLDQLKAALISLLLMYNVRSEKQLERRLFWEKIRLNSSRVSMHSFHTTPINAINNKTNHHSYLIQQELGGGVPNHQNPLYATSCKSMYELGTHAAQRLAAQQTSNQGSSSINVPTFTPEIAPRTLKAYNCTLYNDDCMMSPDGSGGVAVYQNEMAAASSANHIQSINMSSTPSAYSMNIQMNHPPNSHSNHTNSRPMSENFVALHNDLGKMPVCHVPALRGGGDRHSTAFHLSPLEIVSSPLNASQSTVDF